MRSPGGGHRCGRRCTLCKAHARPRRGGRRRQRRRCDIGGHALAAPGFAPCESVCARAPPARAQRPYVRRVVCHLCPPPPPPRSMRTRDSVGSGPRTRVRVHSVLPSRNQSCQGQWLGSPSRNPFGSEIACPPSGRRAMGVRGRARRKRHGPRGPMRSDGGKFPERARAGAHPPAFRPMLQTGPFDPPQRVGGNRGDSI